VYYPHPVSYLISSFWAENFGHWIVDDMLANMLDLGIHVPDIPYVVHNGCMALHRHEESDRHSCTLFWSDYSKVFTKISRKKKSPTSRDSIRKVEICSVSVLKCNSSVAEH
jgi:hypothetical protein